MSHALSSPVTYRARWVWSEGRWIENGRVTVAGSWIVAVGTERQSGEIDLGDQLLLPGLVNAHTHLEFSGLAEPLPYEKTFASWIRNVVQWRRGQSDDDCRAAIEWGLAESARAGVAALGEISTRIWASPVPVDEISRGVSPTVPHRPHVVVFDEVLGLLPAAIEPQMEDARRHVGFGGVLVSEGQPQLLDWSAGLSPHAPYSVGGELFSQVVSLASNTRCPVAMHLAETREELELLATGTGPLVDLFTEWGLWKPGQRAAFRSPLEVLQQLSPLSRVLVIHGNYLSETELNFLAGKDPFTVVYCPRTHAYFEHDRYPLTALRQRGIRVALGTDSRASNPDLSLLSEARLLAQLHPEIAPADVLQMATRSGAEALGMEHLVGTIAPNKRASFCVLPMPAGVRDPYEAVLHSPSMPLEPL